MAGEPITQEEMIAMFGKAMPIEAVQLVWGSDDTKTLGEIRDELRAIAKRRNIARDDSDVVEAALRAQAKNGNMVLRRTVEINGIEYQPATYILTYVGEAQE